MSKKPTAIDFIAIFDGLIEIMGAAAFGVVEAALCHSGPEDATLCEIFGRAKATFLRNKKRHRNFARASRIIQRTRATCLETMRLGGALNALEVYAFFEQEYAPDKEEGIQEADKVWRYLSRKFAETVSGKVITCVCGADRARVFFQEELPALAANDKIETINNVPWIKIHDAYRRDPEEAYRLICRSEMRMAWDLAKTEATKEAVEDFYYCRAYYRVDRRRSLEHRGEPVPPSMKRRTQKEHREALAHLRARLVASACSC